MHTVSEHAEFVSRSHRYVVEGLHHASLESVSLELQDDAEGQQDSDARHAGGAQDRIETACYREPATRAALKEEPFTITDFSGTL